MKITGNKDDLGAIGSVFVKCYNIRVAGKCGNCILRDACGKEGNIKFWEIKDRIKRAGDNFEIDCREEAK